ncbi:hypothetical protein [Paraburkholderia aromaticivorans]|uniref:hypothetical protein n=1 Tax=Paraburkholderia aromaticivorans TaxID=2026199 RepID=UPI0012FD8C48|nr:hypothetical protein [Paraburkholderia aromaticivorans]
MELISGVLLSGIYCHARVDQTILRNQRLSEKARWFVFFAIIDQKIDPQRRMGRSPIAAIFQHIRELLDESVFEGCLR